MKTGSPPQKHRRNVPISPRLIQAIEYLPASRMDLAWACRRAGFGKAYSRKVVSRFARDERLQDMVRARVQQLLEQAGEGDKEIIATILQREHFQAHPQAGITIVLR